MQNHCNNQYREVLAVELDRKIGRKKLETLMSNPLAKELWVTEAKNFDDPSFIASYR